MARLVLRAVGLVLAGLVVLPSARAGDLFDDDFVGWDALRVLSLEGRLAIFEVADLDQDGRDEVIFANERRGRLEIVRWLAPAERKERSKQNRPNAFPIALDFERDEVRLDFLPNEVIALNVDDDRELELAVLVVEPAKILIVDRPTGTSNWEVTREHELERGPVDSWQSLRIVPGRKEPTLWISKKKGICELPLVDGERGEWRDPREKTGRSAFWFLDIDHDGDPDLVEFTIRSKGIRWHENLGDRWAPSRVVGNREYEDMEPCLAEDGTATLIAIPRAPANIAQRLRMTKDDVSPVGVELALPIPDGVDGRWTSVVIDEKPALAYVDPEQPVLVVHTLSDSGWSDGARYPIVADVEALTAPPAEPGTILFRTKDAKRLHRSEWSDGRMSFPRPWALREIGEGDGEVLSLGTDGSVTWWTRALEDKKAKKFGVELVSWTSGSEPVAARFDGIGKKEVDKARWMTRSRILFQEKFARSPKLADLSTGEPVVSEPSALGKAAIGGFSLIPRVVDGKPTLWTARLQDGVLQWLDDEFEPLDQVMLGEGRNLTRYIELESGESWALEAGNEKLHKLAADEGGVLRPAESWDVPRTVDLRVDRHLGPLLIGADRVTKIAPGRPWTLEVVETIDEVPGKPNDLDEIGIHRVIATDATDAPGTEILLFDDVRRICRMFGQTKEGLKPICTWPIYEDRSYPYGGESGDNQVREPRFVRGLDLDGDGFRDLAMICHNRLLMYIARAEESEDEKGTQ